MAGGAAAGATSAALGGGNILQGALMGAVIGGVTGGILGEVADTYDGWSSAAVKFTGAAMAVAGGIPAYAQGGLEGLAVYGVGVLAACGAGYALSYAQDNMSPAQVNSAQTNPIATPQTTSSSVILDLTQNGVTLQLLSGPTTMWNADAVPDYSYNTDYYTLDPTKGVFGGASAAGKGGYCQPNCVNFL